jgi:16S rRNA (guanine1516-N2)-methyltransferase
MSISASVAIVSDAASPQAVILATRLGLPLYTTTNAGNACDFLLRFEPNADGMPPRLTLIRPDGGLGNGITVDFTGGRLSHRRRFGGGRGQPLARAIGLKRNTTPSVVDATAGLGRDAFVLAWLGARVTLVERSPVLTALLGDGLARLAADAELSGQLPGQLELVTADAIDWLSHCPATQRPDVIYLDPMYPHRRKSALVKKEMRALRALVGDDGDANELLHAALDCARKRVVVKRPVKAPALVDDKHRQPAGKVLSKNTRYDIYPCG